jgi:hypothetical protein
MFRSVIHNVDSGLSNGGSYNGGSYNGGSYNGGSYNGGSYNGGSYSGSSDSYNGGSPSGGSYSGGPGSYNDGYASAAAAAVASSSTEAEVYVSPRSLPPLPRADSGNYSSSVTICQAFNENFSVSKNGYGLKSSVNISETVVECIYFDGEACYYDRHVRIPFGHHLSTKLIIHFIAGRKHDEGLAHLPRLHPPYQDHCVRIVTSPSHNLV